MGACASGAGGHYKINPSLTAVEETNELWPKVISDGNGFGYGSLEVNHVAGADAVSVVIHGGPASAKVACADLVPARVNQFSLGGSFAPVGTATPMLGGNALLVRKANGQSETRLAVKGLAAATMYMAHVHVLTCAENSGGHYKIDETVTTAVESNEIFLRFTANATGMSGVQVEVPQTARPDAISVIVHDPVDGAKLLCADLN